MARTFYEQSLFKSYFKLSMRRAAAVVSLLVSTSGSVNRVRASAAGAFFSSSASASASPEMADRIRVDKSSRTIFVDRDASFRHLLTPPSY